MLAGIFGGILTIYWVGSLTLMSLVELSRWLAFFCLIGLFIPARLYHRFLSLYQFEIFFFNLFAVGPLALSVLLLANFLLSSSETYTVSKKTIEYEQVERTLLNNAVGFRWQLENDTLDEYPNLRLFYAAEHSMFMDKVCEITFEFREGFLGWPLIENKQIEHCSN